MPGVARLQDHFTFQLDGARYGDPTPTDIALAITEGARGVLQVADGVSDQALTVPGFTTFTGLRLVADQAISVKLHSTGNTATTLAAGYPMEMLGVSVAGVWVSNASGSTANVHYSLVG